MVQLQPISELYVEIGDRIKAARLKKEMSRKNLADKIGITSQQLQKYEKGYVRLSVCRLLEITNCLDIPLTYFVEQSAAWEGLSTDKYDTLVINSLAKIKNKEFKKIISELCKTQHSSN